MADGPTPLFRYGENAIPYSVKGYICVQGRGEAKDLASHVTAAAGKYYSLHGGNHNQPQEDWLPLWR